MSSVAVGVESSVVRVIVVTVGRLVAAIPDKPVLITSAVVNAPEVMAVVRAVVVDATGRIAVTV